MNQSDEIARWAIEYLNSLDYMATARNVFVVRNTYVIFYVKIYIIFADNYIVQPTAQTQHHEDQSLFTAQCQDENIISGTYL